MHLNTQNISVKEKRHSLSPRLEILGNPLKVALIVGGIMAFALSIILTGYYSEVTMRTVATVGIVVINTSLLFILAHPWRSRPARRSTQAATEILFAIICFNLIALLASLWGDFLYSDLVLRYCVMLNVSILAIIAPLGILESSDTSWVPRQFGWVKYVMAGSIAVGLLLFLPVIYHYIGRSWVEILSQSQPPLPRIYFNSINLFFYTAIGSSLFLAYLKLRYQKKSA